MNRTMRQTGRLPAFVALLLAPVLAVAAPLIDQIKALKSDPEYNRRIEQIRQLEPDGYRAELQRILDEALAELTGAEVERDELEAHGAAIRGVIAELDRFRQLQDFAAVKTVQFDTDVDEFCVIADRTFPNHVVYDCDTEYRHAINIWRRSEFVRALIADWKQEAREYSLRRIRESEQRWQQFSANVTSDQFPWETIVNGWLVPGTVATPPHYQFRLLHPVAVLSYAEDAGRYDEEVGVEVFGLRTYDDKYVAEWGLSVFALLESGDATDTGWGLSLSRKNLTFAVITQDTAGKEDDTKLLLGYNLATLFDNKSAEWAEMKQQWRVRLDQFESDLTALTN